MEKQALNIKVLSWPTPQEYNEAVQNASATFADPELKEGQPALNSLGLPLPISGAFASVYRMHCAGKDWAIRCFLRNVPDQNERYEKISEQLSMTKLPCMVPFQFLEKGILLHGEWFPALKMEWVDGVHLNDYVERHLRNSHKLHELSDKWLNMIDQLRQARIAHGDLQHGNVLVDKDDFKLVDYDGTYVPSLRGYKSNEIGHRNYQHPGRTCNHFGPFLDNFSAWVIYVSLHCLAIDPNIWAELDAGDECMLFRQRDFADPLNSRAFFVLENHFSKEINLYARNLRYMLSLLPEEVPVADDRVPEPLHLPPLTGNYTLSMQMRSGSFPEWMSMPAKPSEAGSESRAESRLSNTSRKIPNATTPAFFFWLILFICSAGLLTDKQSSNEKNEAAENQASVDYKKPVTPADSASEPPGKPIAENMPAPTNLLKRSRFQQAIEQIKLANELYKNGDYLKASARYEEIRGKYSKEIGGSNNEALRARLYELLSSCYIQLGQWQKAEPVMKYSLDLSRDERSFLSEDAAYDMSDLGLIEIHLKHYKEAAKLLQDASESIGQWGPKPVLGIVYERLAFLYEQQGQPEKAEPFHKRAMSVYEVSTEQSMSDKVREAQQDINQHRLTSLNKIIWTW